MAAIKRMPVDRPDWSIQLWECGDIGQCCYSYWCPTCAAAQARTNLDGTILMQLIRYFNEDEITMGHVENVAKGHGIFF